MPRRALFAFFIIALVFAPLAEAKKTVCTITVNSADEKETFRARLPKGEYEFVELVEKGRPDWLRSSCRKQVQCDVLVVSGHFNAGDTFYSDQLDREEYLEIDELERASCSASCPGLFSKLKEVYLFGCESLNPNASFNGTGESGRERMRRIFPDVPVIYGFSSSAPVGPTAAMLLRRYFDRAGRSEIGTGRPSARLLQAFSRNSMVRVSGVGRSGPAAEHRAQVCRFFDERSSAAQKLGFVHALLKAQTTELPDYFRRVERLFESLTDEERAAGDFSQTLAQISADEQARDRYLAAMRRTKQHGIRARMIAMAGTFGWLDERGQRGETVAMVNEMLAAREVGFAEVDLACRLNADDLLDSGQLGAGTAVGDAVRSAILACLGDDAAHGRVLRALSSPDERDVRIAQVYLRHRPLSGKGELRGVVAEVARMSGQAQVRALDTIARLHISDHEILDDLARAFAQARTVDTQRAIAEVFIRSDPSALPRPGLAAVLRQHRLPSPGGKPDLIDALLARLQG
ncbi:MAG TPA: hypothetical protein VEC19_11225 [Usitatibacter sp.]|nr:hypothetical protein [Usitatibacter sp.]